MTKTEKPLRRRPVRKPRRGQTQPIEKSKIDPTNGLSPADPSAKDVIRQLIENVAVPELIRRHRNEGEGGGDPSARPALPCAMTIVGGIMGGRRAYGATLH